MLEQLDTANWHEIFDDGADKTFPYAVENPVKHYPWREVNESGPLETFSAPVTRDDVAEIIAYYDSSDQDPIWGEWDGSMVARLHDGRFIFAGGWCDTSGWGCQDGVSRYVGPSVASLVRWALSNEDRKNLGLELS